MKRWSLPWKKLEKIIFLHVSQKFKFLASKNLDFLPVFAGLPTSMSRVGSAIWYLKNTTFYFFCYWALTKKLFWDWPRLFSFGFRKKVSFCLLNVKDQSPSGELKEVTWGVFSFLKIAFQLLKVLARFWLSNQNVWLSKKSTAAGKLKGLPERNSFSSMSLTCSSSMKRELEMPSSNLFCAIKLLPSDGKNDVILMVNGKIFLPHTFAYY